MSKSQSYRQAFLRLAIDLGALRFGNFTLKSGRQSPYFFNAGVFCTGQAIADLGRFYAAVIMEAGLQPDVLFGPAYKGIPIAAVAAGALADCHDVDIPFAYNRKEAKTHGEGGELVGGAVNGQVVIVDDVITAGTAIRQAIGMIGKAGGSVAGVVLALDRQERGQGLHSATQELAQELEAPVLCIASLSDLIAMVADNPNLAQHLDAMEAYRDAYGV